MSVSFSFVVPACNVALYVNEMIASLKSQTLSDFEAIIVSEESTDGTREKLSASIAGDPRFQSVFLPRSGSASVSRNYGIEHAKNEYLVFVDGDDWIEPDALERLAAEAEKYHHPDLILIDWNVHRENADGTESVHLERCHHIEPGKVYGGPDSLVLRLNGRDQPGTQLHICHRQFLLDHGLRQVPGRRHQDSEWLPRLNYFAKTVVYMPDTYYHYRKRPLSVTTKKDPKSMSDFTDNNLSFLDFYEKYAKTPALKRAMAKMIGISSFCYFLSDFSDVYVVALRKKEFYRLCPRWSDAFHFAGVLMHGGLFTKFFALLVLLGRLPAMFRSAAVLFRVTYAASKKLKG